MKDRLISEYINKLSYNDIDVFGRKNDIILTDEEIVLLHKIVKKNWRDLIYGDPTPILNNVKNNFSNQTYQKMENLFYLYKNKYKNYF